MTHVESSRGWVVLPVHNEERFLGGVLEGIRKVLGDQVVVLVVDDGSTDRSAAEALRAGARVVRHPFNMGYGVSLQTGFKAALRGGASWVVIMDADGQHDPVSLPILLAPVLAGRADVVVGSRFLGSPDYRMPFSKQLGVGLFRLLARLLADVRVTDPTSGFQAYGRRATAFCTHDDFPFDFPDTDLLILLKKAGLKLEEVPVRMHNHPQGKTMHAGLVPYYYVFKMGVSILATMLRESHSYLGRRVEDPRPGSPS